MKNIHNLVGIALITLFSFTSCIKPITNDDTKPAGPVTGMTCQMEGLTWHCNATTVVSNKGMSIVGQTSDGQTISMELCSARQGVYSVYAYAASTASYRLNNNEEFVTNYQDQGSGMVTITAIDEQAKTVSGTFSFQAVRPSDLFKKDVRNGVFTNLPYTGGLPAQSGMLYAQIDKLLWTNCSILVEAQAGTLYITASENIIGVSMNINVPENITPGTYPLSATGSCNIVYHKFSNTYPPVSGTITITSKTANTISATYNLKAANQANPSDVVNISSGGFDIHY